MKPHEKLSSLSSAALAAVGTGLAIVALAVRPLAAQSGTPPSVQAAIVGEASANTGEVSTEELRQILAAGSAVVLDARPLREYELSHIPGAKNVAAKPGVAMSLYVSDVAEVGRLVRGEKGTALVLYCNGPHCGKSKRLAEELLGAGFTNVRRYQLGIPVWRALGGVCTIEPGAVKYVAENDRTAVFLDAREPSEFAAGSAPGARSLARSRLGPSKDTGEVKAAKDDGRLPMEDHNTRIVVFGADADQARTVAEAVAREAFHNVTYFPGTYDEFRRSLQP
jgi:rhodanese-related sulfurtransferase